MTVGEGTTAREERLKRQLRANLRRRKARAREVAAGAEDVGDEAAQTNDLRRSPSDEPSPRE